MRNTVFKRCMAFLFVVALVLSQSVSVMAMVAMDTGQAPAASPMNMAGMSMPASHQGMKSCCTHPEKNKAMKDAMCAACCATTMQSAVAPPQFLVPVRYAVEHVYELTDSMAVGELLPPEPPPPKA